MQSRLSWMPLCGIHKRLSCLGQAPTHFLWVGVGFSSLGNALVKTEQLPVKRLAGCPCVGLGMVVLQQAQHRGS